MKNYIALSLETHLFFARIMKEHAFFLEAGFPCKNRCWIKKAEQLREQFENLLRESLQISNGQIHNCVITSDELVTEFTLKAEQRTQHLSGIAIDTRLTSFEQQFCTKCNDKCDCNHTLFRKVTKINHHSLHLLDELISFKEAILQEVRNGTLFTANYPLLIEHIIREARLYQCTIEKLLAQECFCYKDLFETENFWNRIMMEHALFIRGLLDPSEEELIDTADGFACDYKKLLEMAKERDSICTNELTEESLAETLQYKQFKTAGITGILNCEIASIILPLLADHVLREANHYIRLLTCNHTD